MKNIHKKLLLSVALVSFLGIGMFFGIGIANVNAATCSPACVAPLVCANGGCAADTSLPSHAVTPNTSGAGSAGQIQDTKIPGTTTQPSDIIKCGRPGQNMCTLCDLISGFNNIIQYLMKIAIGMALLAISIGGVMYVVSAGDSGLIDSAKSVMKNAAIGFVIIFAAFLIINTTIEYLGTKTDAAGNLTFGFHIVSWGHFDCTANPNR